MAASVPSEHKELILDWLALCVDELNVTEKYVFVKEINSSKFVVIYDKGQGGDANDIHALQLLFCIHENFGLDFLNMLALIRRNVLTPSIIEQISLACYLTAHPRKVDRERLKGKFRSGLPAHGQFYGRFPFCTVAVNSVCLNRDMTKSDRRKDNQPAHFILGGIGGGFYRLVVSDLDVEVLTYYQMIQYYKTLCAFYMCVWANMVSGKRPESAFNGRMKTVTKDGMTTCTLTVRNLTELRGVFTKHGTEVKEALVKAGKENIEHLHYLLKPFN